jgi:hypothetical protein
MEVDLVTAVSSSEDEQPSGLLDALERLGGAFDIAGDGLGDDASINVADLCLAMEVAAPPVAADSGGLDLSDIDRLAQLSRREEVPRRVAERRSFEAMEHARAGKAKLDSQRREAALKGALTTKDAQLQKVARNFPEIARVLGVSGGSTGGRGKEITEERAEHLMLISYSPSQPKGMGTSTWKNLVSFTSRFAESCQQHGLFDLLGRCAAFQALSNTEHVCTCTLGYSHESDSTCQALAQAALQSFGRPATKRLATEVLNQRGSFFVLLQKINRRTGAVVLETTIQHDWHSHSLALLGKTGPFILKALQLGMPFSMGTPAWDDWQVALAASVDVFILDQHGDQGSNNFPAFRHIACTGSEVPRAAMDISCCEIHSIQAIKNSSLEIKEDVGKLFCLSNLCALGSFHHNLISTLFWLAHNTVRRVVGRPPADQSGDVRALFDVLYNFDAPYHQRTGGRESLLMQDLRLLASIPLYEASAFSFGEELVTRVHFCWDEEEGGPCCQDEEETCERVALGNVNFHGSSAFEKPSLGRFTHVAMARKRIIVGMTSQKLALQAISSCCNKTVESDPQGNAMLPQLSVAEAGSRTDDQKLTTLSRCKRLSSWLERPSTYFRLPIAEATESILDSLQYEFFGRDRSSIAAEDLLDRSTSPIGRVMGDFWKLASSWPPDRVGPWRVLYLTKCCQDFTNQDVLMCARANCLGLLAMSAVKFDRKFAGDPWLLGQLISKQTTEAERLEIATALVAIAAADKRCLPLFCRELLEIFPTVADLLSAAAAGAIRVWLKGKRFCTKASELGHARERHELAAANAPGKSFVPHSERDFLHRHRISHVVRGGRDPYGSLRLRGVKGRSAGKHTHSHTYASTIHIMHDPFVFGTVILFGDRVFYNRYKTDIPWFAFLAITVFCCSRPTPLECDVALLGSGGFIRGWFCRASVFSQDCPLQSTAHCTEYIEYIVYCAHLPPRAMVRSLL